MERHAATPIRARGHSRGIRLLASGAAALAAVVASVAAVAVTPASAAPTPFLSHFNNVDVVASTVPSTGPGMGDQNPYGVANVPFSIGDLVPRRHARQQLQLEQQHAGHRHDDHAGGAERPGERVRPDRCQPRSRVRAPAASG